LASAHKQALRYRAQLRAGNDAAISRLARSYAATYKRLLTQLRALEADIQEYQATGKVFSMDWLRRQERYRELLVQCEVGMRRYGAVLQSEIGQLVDAAITQAERDAVALVRMRLPLLPDRALRSMWNRLPSEAIESLLGFTAADSPLTARMEKFGEGMAARMGARLEESLSIGYSPRTLAATFRKELGLDLTSALRHARTTQISAYREATRLAYAANPQIVPSWTWVSALSSGTCLACIAKHGTIHPNSERLNDHWAGWCVMSPVTVSYRDLGLRVDGPDLPAIPTGQDALRAMPASEARGFFGKDEELYQAWLDGKITADKFAVEREDPVWGSMIAVSPKGVLLPQVQS